MSDLSRMRHQIGAAELAATHGSYAIFAETGTGKTWIGIDIIRRFPGPALVVCPLSIIEPAWFHDLARVAPNLKATSLHATTPRKRRALLANDARNPADVYLVNFAGFRMLERDHRKWLEAKNFQVLLIDESSAIKSHKAAITKAVLRFGSHVPHRFVMSGTPAPNVESEYWPQMQFVAPGLLKPNYYWFLREWFHPAVVDPTNPRVVWKWSITKEKREALLQIVARRACFYRKADCLDLPEQLDEVRHVLMGAKQAAAYRAMKNDLIAELGGSGDFHANTAMAANRLAQIMKLRQITAGCLATLDGTMHWEWDAKLLALREVLGELGDSQAVVWTQFHVEADAICSELAGVATVLDGRVPADVRPAIIRDFVSGATRYLIAHPACAGHGLTLTNAHYAIYTSLSYSLEQYWQSRDRLHRIGQRNPVTYIHLLCPQTIDEVLYRVLRRKGDMARAAAELIAEWRGKE